MKKTTVELDEDLYRRARTYCAMHGLTFKHLVSTALSQFLEEAEVKNPGKYTNQVIEAMKACGLTERVASGIFQRMCEKHGLPPETVTPWSADIFFKRDIYEAVRKLLPSGDLAPLAHALKLEEMEGKR